MLKRPSAKDDEDDILRQQEEFLRSKGSTAAATVVNKRKTNVETKFTESQEASSVKRPRSKFSASRQATRSSDPISKPSEVSSAILGDIIERTVVIEADFAPTSSTATQGFPKPFKRDKMLTQSGKSIFAQQLENMKQECMSSTSSHTMDVGETASTSVHDVAADGRSFIVSGPDAKNIHEENIKKINSLSVEEIERERQNIIATVDPKILEFIKSKRQIFSDKEIKRPNFKSPQQKDSLMLDTSKSKKKNSSKMEVDSAQDSNDESMDLPSEVMELNEWFNMDFIEKDKIQWMMDLSDAKPIPPGEMYNARFDFEGILLPYSDESIDVRKALHHHGDEPERPGYTLQELYQLSRSSVLQQRVLAITTIANVLDKIKMGYYDRCFEAPLFQQVLDSDLFLLLRFSLDDSAESQVSATLTALRNLLFNQPDEVCLDVLFGFPNGHWQPSLDVKSPTTKQADVEEQEEHEAEMKDHQILKLDLIKGALRTDLILRLRYILEILKPSPKAVIDILEILTRIARHSIDSAHAIACCPRLVSFIITKFLPRDWSTLAGPESSVNMDSVYGIPLVPALKLMRVLASHSRALASDLVHKSSLMRSLGCYITIDSRECFLPQKEAFDLCLESFYTVQVLISYGFGIEVVRDLFPIFTRFLQYHIQLTSISNTISQFDFEHGSALISLLTQALQSEIDVKSAAAEQGNLTLSNLSFTSEQLDYLGLIENCAIKWLQELKSDTELSFSATRLVGSTLRYIATNYSYKYREVDLNPAGRPYCVETLADVIPLFLKSSNYNSLMSRVRLSSYLLSDFKAGTERDPECLPSLGSLFWNGEDFVPLLKPQSPFPALIGLVHILNVCMGKVQNYIWDMNKKVELHKCVKAFLDNRHLQTYISQLISVRKKLPSSNWFSQYETSFLVLLVKLSFAARYSDSDVYYLLALRLLSLVQTHNKYHLKSIFSDVIFSLDISREQTVLKKLESLTVNSSDSDDQHNLLTSILNELSDIRRCYITALGLDDLTEPSTLNTATLTCSAKDREPYLSDDWIFLPITLYYKKELSGQPASDTVLKTIRHCLQWVYVLECLGPKSGNSLCVTTKFCRLATVFLVASDLFLDPEIAKYLDIILKKLVAKNSEFNFNKTIPGLLSFYDLYVQLLEQFSAVSYGNKLFGQFLLIPLQQRHSVELRKLFWTEYPTMLRMLPAKWDEPYVPHKAFVYPKETEPSLLSCYLRCLVGGVLTEKQSPVLYNAAASHIATLIAEHPGTELSKQLRETIENLKNKELQKFLLGLIQKSS